MARLVAFDAVFFLLPFLIYAGWLFATRGHVGGRGEWSMRIITYLAIGGALLMVGAVLAFIQFDTERLDTNASGKPISRHYVPARVENGKVVPGHFE
ncbi:MAG TPA: DUF6111 family protein [Bauldia sp.]|nr:DUF6111 family protein [Bauldia sp.]